MYVPRYMWQYKKQHHSSTANYRVHCNKMEFESVKMFADLRALLPAEALITAILVEDVRFPTSAELHGSDAIHKDPDYSCAYVVISVGGVSATGHGLTFTLGRGTEVVVAAIKALQPLLLGQSLLQIYTDFGRFWHQLTNESQLRWIGPEKGAVHLATAAVVNALWDLWGKIQNKPVWKLLSDMTPHEIVSLVDFTHLSDLLTPADALALLTSLAPGRSSREQQLLQSGYPCYITSAGWLGYSDEKVSTLCKKALNDGFTRFKMKVGVNVEDDTRRARLMRREIGPNNVLMMDANQVWEVSEAVKVMKTLSEFSPLFIEEPTSPDDILGHAAIRKALCDVGVKVATGEMCHNKVMFKQFLAAGAMDYCQVDSCRLGGLNEVIAVLLMAAKCGVPVCPHAGGVGLCQYVQHISMIDYLCVSGSTEGRMIEYADHLHEHFMEPLDVRQGAYYPPTRPGYSQMKQDSIEKYRHTN